MTTIVKLEKVYYTYILRLSNGTFYTGITNDIHRRLSEHAAGQSKSTRHALPASLAWYGRYNTRKESRRMEVKIKNLGAKKYLIREKYY